MFLKTFEILTHFIFHAIERAIKCGSGAPVVDGEGKIMIHGFVLGFVFWMEEGRNWGRKKGEKDEEKDGWMFCVFFKRGFFFGWRTMYCRCMVDQTMYSFQTMYVGAIRRGWLEN